CATWDYSLSGYIF
nr:immunoglobulin light chain junction region [Macaca mulatta]MPO05695.1 immunoglobulin light chain junction region [Macaca mulatta]MPO06910.1 immunoglobulin light chain junction region [Macaca mulatta]MPO07927.1 immunoglobulin light chain junction region [Macaca mulatta]MPO08246.1 immunoglobulin light chain junction region [Macaca mulatta]